MTIDYPGSELALFAEARHWKRYVADLLRPFVGARVLEVGAGLGANIPYLHDGAVREWIALEPDPAMARGLADRIAAGRLPPTCRAVAGALTALDDDARFDTILYLDVLEHIEDDRGELARAARHLDRGGHLVVLAPAHQYLFTEFDRAIGHYRRYGRAALLGAAPPALALRRCRMVDSVGCFASLGNRWLLRAARPTARQIRLWDNVMVPLSRLADPATGYRFGKSIVAVWTADVW